MAHHQSDVRYAAVGGAVGWFALGLQFYLTNVLVLSQGRSFQAALFVLLGYYTILTNLLAATALTIAALRPEVWFRTLSRPLILGGIGVSMTLVGIVYNVILRQLWHPTGLTLVADELLHVVMPIVFIVYWWLWVPKATLRWRDSLSWALYPILYFVYVLIRGAISGAYPYPFIDVGLLGYGVALKNSVGMLIAFLGVAAIFIAAGRWKSRTSSASIP